MYMIHAMVLPVPLPFPGPHPRASLRSGSGCMTMRCTVVSWQGMITDSRSVVRTSLGLRCTRAFGDARVVFSARLPCDVSRNRLVSWIYRKRCFIIRG